LSVRNHHRSGFDPLLSMPGLTIGYPFLGSSSTSSANEVRVCAAGGILLFASVISCSSRRKPRWRRFPNVVRVRIIPGETTAISF